MTDPQHPCAVVQRQLDAYNARDVDQIRARLALRFQEPNLHARLLQRVVMGNIVIDHELVTRSFPEGTGTVHMVAIYEVVDGKIVSASVQVSDQRLDAQR